MKVILEGGEVLVNPHKKSDCAGRACCIHKRTDHHMRNFPQHFRMDRLLMERICPHGVGHPDPDHLTYIRERYGEKFAAVESVHGCDGCCANQPQQEGELNI